MVVWLLLIFAWAANFVIRIGFSALLPSIMSELSLSYTRAGLLASAFFYAYVIMQIPSGLLGDRYGRRRILLLGLLGGALSAGLTGLAGSFAALFTARALTGAFQGSLFSNDRAIIATVTPPDRIGLGQGVSFAGPGLGLTAGLVIGGLLVEVLPWRTVMMLEHEVHHRSQIDTYAGLQGWPVPDIFGRSAESITALQPEQRARHRH